MADRLRCCQLTWTVSQYGKLVTVVGHQFLTLTVDMFTARWTRGTALRGSVSGSGDLWSF